MLERFLDQIGEVFASARIQTEFWWSTGRGSSNTTGFR